MIISCFGSNNNQQCSLNGKNSELRKRPFIASRASQSSPETAEFFAGINHAEACQNDE